MWNDTHENHETIRRLHEVTQPADFLLWSGDTCKPRGGDVVKMLVEQLVKNCIADRAFVVGVSACWLMIACDDATGPEKPARSAPPDVRAWVTGEAADQLDSEGHFVLPAPAPAGAEPIITEETA